MAPRTWIMPKISAQEYVKRHRDRRGLQIYPKSPGALRAENTAREAQNQFLDIRRREDAEYRLEEGKNLSQEFKSAVQSHARRSANNRRSAHGTAVYKTVYQMALAKELDLSDSKVQDIKRKVQEVRSRKEKLKIERIRAGRRMRHLQRRVQRRDELLRIEHTKSEQLIMFDEKKYTMSISSGATTGSSSVPNTDNETKDECNKNVKKEEIRKLEPAPEPIPEPETSSPPVEVQVTEFVKVELEVQEENMSWSDAETMEPMVPFEHVHDSIPWIQESETDYLNSTPIPESQESEVMGEFIDSLP